ncbi:hypothetical protein, partial [Snodgrassella sp. CS2]|uniref:hypothetical protein n=1 Tax=Snodgrassella sp. CS2 TaxID=3418953 RepID=UPI003D032862
FNNHSRGSLTDKVSTAYLQNVKGITDIPIEKTKYLGPAANIVGEYDMLEKITMLINMVLATPCFWAITIQTLLADW